MQNVSKSCKSANGKVKNDLEKICIQKEVLSCIREALLGSGTCFCPRNLCKKSIFSQEDSWGRRIMLIQLSLFFMIVYVILSVIIIVQSSLVIAVLGREWILVKRLSPLDLILAALATSHFFRQWFSILCDYFIYCYHNFEFWYLQIIWDCTNITTFWITSLLAVFYCVKISSFTHTLLLWLKWRIPRSVPWLLLGSILLSCVTTIPSSTVLYYMHFNIYLESSFRNYSGLDRFNAFARHFIWPHQMAMMSIPFLLFLTTIILLLTSLLQHLKQMQDHSSGHCNSSMKAHAKALKNLAFFLIFFSSYFLTLSISVFSQLFEEFSFWAWEAVIYSITSIHSTSLMLSSPTLRTFLKNKLLKNEVA